MFEIWVNKSWYEKRWLTPVVVPVRGRIGRALARLGDMATRGYDPGDAGSWRIPPL